MFRISLVCFSALLLCSSSRANDVEAVRLARAAVDQAIAELAKPGSQSAAGEGVIQPSPQTPAVQSSPVIRYIRYVGGVEFWKRANGVEQWRFPSTWKMGSPTIVEQVIEFQSQSSVIGNQSSTRHVITEMIDGVWMQREQTTPIELPPVQQSPIHRSQPAMNTWGAMMSPMMSFRAPMRSSGACAS